MVGLGIAEIQSVFSEESTSNLVEMFKRNQTPMIDQTQAARQILQNHWILREQLCYPSPPLTRSKRGSRDDMELSFDEFYEMLCSTCRPIIGVDYFETTQERVGIEGETSPMTVLLR